MYIGLHVKYPFFWSDFNETWILSTIFWKILECRISCKSVQWEPSCSVRSDGRTDMTKLIVAFHNFANAPKKQGRKSKVSLSTPWRRTGGEEVQFHSFLTSALNGGWRLISGPYHITQSSMGWLWNHITLAALKSSYDPEHRENCESARGETRDKTKGLGCVEDGPSPSITRSAACMAQWWPHGNQALSGAVAVHDGNTSRARREPAALDDGTKTQRVPLYRCARQWRWGLNSNYRPGRRNFKFQLPSRTEEF